MQYAMAIIELGDDDGDGAARARDLVARIPDPVSPIEKALLRGFLLDVSLLWAVLAHRRIHKGDPAGCQFRDEVLVHEAWQRAQGFTAPARTTFVAWAARYFRSLHRAHPSPSEAAARWIAAHSRERVTDAVVARAVGVHVRTLRQDFKAVFGISMTEYRQRARLLDALRLLASGRQNVRSALSKAGWRSPKAIYETATALTSKTLDELRALPRQEWEGRLVLSMPPTRRPGTPARTGAGCQIHEPKTVLKTGAGPRDLLEKDLKLCKREGLLQPETARPSSYLS